MIGLDHPYRHYRHEANSHLMFKAPFSEPMHTNWKNDTY